MTTCTATDHQGRRCGLELDHETRGQTMHVVAVTEQPDHTTPGFGYVWPAPRPPRQLTIEEASDER